MRPDLSRDLTRRDVLAAGLATAGVLALGGRAPALGADSPAAGPYGPFKMGLQSYSLRGGKDAPFPLDVALAKTKELGLGYWEGYPAHLPMTTEGAAIARYKSALSGAGVKLNGYGVVRLSKDRDANRKFFEFGQAMGIAYLSADPDPDSFDVLDKLVEEFSIAVGIHPHGPGHRYATIDIMMKAIKDHHELIGCCLDTGHLLRARQDPLQAVEAFGKRIYGVHLKDVKDAKTFTILGQGDLRLPELLKALATRKYEHCMALEYEENPQDPMSDLRACLDTQRKAASSL